MVAGGIQRKLDELGRIVIPNEMRKALYIRDGDRINITRVGNTIVLEKYEEADTFTGEYGDLLEYKGKKVSRETVRILAGLAGFKVTD
ncbi:MAG: AbrB/MazE/SpoVT family DNA-binding domain-containing protein [Clostridiales bacterium]|nr:AbrB/MazE/SpoVT family DNA-binding domain-containing protein [Clostridiales bacterium]